MRTARADRGTCKARSGEDANASRLVAGARLKIETCVRSLREIDQAPWQELLEPLIVFDAVLRRDPAGAYAHMDPESREMYRSAVVKLAKHSELSELEIAELAWSLGSRIPDAIREDDPVLAQRRAHVGYYLIAEGRGELGAEPMCGFPCASAGQLSAPIPGRVLSGEASSF